MVSWGPEDLLPLDDSARLRLSEVDTRQIQIAATGLLVLLTAPHCSSEDQLLYEAAWPVTPVNSAGFEVLELRVCIVFRVSWFRVGFPVCSLLS